MWQGASEQKIAATRGYGATVDLEATGPGDAFARLDALHGRDRPDARASLRRSARDRRRRHRRPRDRGGRARRRRDRRAGRRRRARSPASRPRSAHGVRVIAVEPELSPALHSGLAHGEPDARSRRRSIADGLTRRSPARLALEITKSLERVLVTEEEIEDAFRFLYERAKLACEPAGAAATAAWLAGKVDAERPGAPRLGRQRRQAKPPLLSWPGHEGRHPPRVRPRDRALRLREHVHHAFDEARAARRDLLELPPVLHRQAEARRHGRPRRALPAAAREGRARRARARPKPWHRPSAARPSSRA